MATSSIVVHALFLRRDRVALVDQLAREAAEALIKAKENDIRKINFAASERIVADELGKTEIEKFFVIWDGKGRVLYESPLAKKVAAIAELPTDSQWASLYWQSKYIRLLNLQMPDFPNRMLQVGVMLNAEFVKPDYFSRSSITFLSCILAIGLVASYLLTSFLLQPLVKLERFLARLSEQAKAQPQLETVPETLLGRGHFKDEFQKMVIGLNSLIQRVNNNYRFSRLWAYQMAHELKTPLSILNIELEQMREKAGLAEKDILPIRKESEKLSDTVNSFLGWAELENTSEQKHLYANHVGAVVKSVADRFAASHPNRIVTEVKSDPTVLANTHHLEQLITNLLTNALAYSAEQVSISVTERTLIVADRGHGIPPSVLERLGEPFNRGDSKIKGHGLGLAWVRSVCRFYGWRLVIDSNQTGTKMSVIFEESAKGNEVSSRNAHAVIRQ